MARAKVEAILADHDHAWRRVARVIDGLTEEEYYWQPAPGALTRRDIWPQPPSGVSTIEWKLAHLAAWKMRYANFLFGDGSHTFDEVRACDTPGKMLAYLEQARTAMQAGLDSLIDDDLAQARRTGWSPPNDRAPIFPTINRMIQHDVYHAGQIATMRGLFRGLRGNPLG